MAKNDSIKNDQNTASATLDSIKSSLESISNYSINTDLKINGILTDMIKQPYIDKIMEGVFERILMLRFPEVVKVTEPSRVIVNEKVEVIRVPEYVEKPIVEKVEVPVLINRKESKVTFYILYSFLLLILFIDIYFNLKA